MAYPQVGSVNGGYNDTASTQHTVNLPSGIAAGDLLLVFFTLYCTGGANYGVSFPSGWTVQYDQLYSNYERGVLYKRIADGTEGSTITVSSTGSAKSAHTSYRIASSGSQGYTLNRVASAVGSGSNTSTPNPPSLSPAWGSDETLWFAVTHTRGNVTVSSYPTGYSNGRNDVGASSDSAGIGTARRELTASSEDPGTFSLSATNRCFAATVGVCAIEKPAVTTQPCSDVTQNSCKGNGTITDTGGENCHTRGFCYMQGTSGDPTIENDKVYDDGGGSYGTGSYSKTISGLQQNTGYRVRAYAINSVGVGYGSTVQVTTQRANPLPTHYVIR